MTNEIEKSPSNISPFERIRRTNEAGNEYWSSRDFAQALHYTDYRNFEQVVQKARMACFNGGQRIEDHFVDITEMIEIGKGGRREVKSVLMSRYACYLVIQNADPSKEIVALGQTYFAVQTRRQELSDQTIEEDRRLLLRDEMKTHKWLHGALQWDDSPRYSSPKAVKERTTNSRPHGKHRAGG